MVMPLRVKVSKNLGEDFKEHKPTFYKDIYKIKIPKILKIQYFRP